MVIPYGAQVQVQVTMDITTGSVCENGISLSAVPGTGDTVRIANLPGVDGKTSYVFDFTASGGLFGIGEAGLLIESDDCLGGTNKYSVGGAAPRYVIVPSVTWTPIADSVYALYQDADGQGQEFPLSLAWSAISPDNGVSSLATSTISVGAADRDGAFQQMLGSEPVSGVLEGGSPHAFSLHAWQVSTQPWRRPLQVQHAMTVDLPVQGRRVRRLAASDPITTTATIGTLIYYGSYGDVQSVAVYRASDNARRTPLTGAVPSLVAGEALVLRITARSYVMGEGGRDYLTMPPTATATVLINATSLTAAGRPMSEAAAGSVVTSAANAVDVDATTGALVLEIPFTAPSVSFSVRARLDHAAFAAPALSAPVVISNPGVRARLDTLAITDTAGAAISSIAPGAQLRAHLTLGAYTGERRLAAAPASRELQGTIAPAGGVVTVSGVVNGVPVFSATGTTDGVSNTVIVALTVPANLPAGTLTFTATLAYPNSPAVLAGGAVATAVGSSVVVTVTAPTSPNGDASSLIIGIMVTLGAVLAAATVFVFAYDAPDAARGAKSLRY
jgi:hypothetical protein